VLFCRDQGLFAARLVALDGSKFRAAASAKRIVGRREIAQEAARLDRRIADYLTGLDKSDDDEPNEAPSATAAALEALRRRRAELDRMASRLDAEGRNTLVEGEEARVRQAFANLAHVAASEGASLADCVRTVVYVTDMAQHRPLANKIAEELWGQGPYPPRTILEVKALSQGDIFEVEGTFYAPLKPG
jgi:enamine deaminase RidA (YjgF/YER057c/UK114 family)